MKYLKEITAWTKAPDTPNHTYIFNEKDENVGYIKTGTTHEIYFSKPSKQFSKSRRKFERIVEVNGKEFKFTKAAKLKVFTVTGSTGNRYKVSTGGRFGTICSCKGYQFRRSCRHINEIKRQLQAA